MIKNNVINAKEIYKCRAFIPEIIPMTKEVGQDDIEYSIFNFNTFSVVKLKLESTTLFFSGANFKLLFNNDYSGEIQDKRMVTIAIGRETFILNLFNKYLNIDIYDENKVLIEVNHIDRNIILKAIDENNDYEYPYISYTLNKLVDKYVVDMYLHPEMGKEKIRIDSVEYELDNELVDYSIKYKEKLYNDNIESLIKICNLANGESLFYTDKAIIGKIVNYNGMLILFVLNMTGDKIDWKTSQLELVSLLNREHYIADMPKWIYYNGVVFDQEFNKTNDKISRIDKLEDLAIMSNDTSAILNKYIEEDKFKEVLENNLEIINAMINEIKDNKYFDDGSILVYNGKCMISETIIEYTKSIISTVERQLKNNEIDKI